jgi:N-acetylmuramoyl-L-alanine amidase
VPSLLAFSALQELIQASAAHGSGSSLDLIQTERFVRDEVLQIICDRALAITGADGVIVGLSEGSALVCRAGSGPLAVERGVHLVPDSEFLRESLDSGRIFCCDDGDVDTRAELDLSHMLCARSTVIVPLRGPRKVVGVVQAFAQRPFAFTDVDIRTFDLFGELLLSALKPEDQDRRLSWLAEVADEILAPPAPEHRAEAPVAELPKVEESQALTEDVALSAIPPVVVSEAHEEFNVPVTVAESALFRDFAAEERPSRPNSLPNLSFATTSRPGLSGVLALIAVAALFSAGVWWGMQNRVGGGRESAESPTTAAVQPVSAVSASSPASDHLLDPARAYGEAAIPNAGQLAVLPKITGIRHWSSSMGSTVVIDMEDQVPYEVHRLTSPERIYFDLHDTALIPDLDGKSIDISDSSLTRVRVAQPVTGVTRVVLDTRNGSNFSVSMEANPYRLIVELRDPSKAQRFASTKTLSPTTRQAPSALLPQVAKREDDQVKAGIGRFRIVLDAGHGGWDLGTVGRDGLLEKDLVLDVAVRLGNLLKNRLAAEVIFTRANDDYLPLDQRAEIANQSQADLFVSVHANYSNLASARGVETYYTNFFSPPGSKEIEKRENGTGARPTPVALSSGELHEKIEESRQLAASVQHSLYATLAARSPGIRDRGVKDSAFVVLTGTAMPAILTEISFVSSPADEQNLRSDSYRQQIAEALYKGIARYESGARHHVKMAQVQPTSAQR